MDRLKEILRRHEGVRNKPYRDTKGILTIGIGWNMEANPLPQDIAAFLRVHGYITNEMIDRLLDISIETATDNCRDIYKDFDSFSENRRFALIDLMFNMGIGTMLTFRNTNRAINEGRWEDAAKGLRYSKWYSQVDKIPDNHRERGDEIIDMIRVG